MFLIYFIYIKFLKTFNDNAEYYIIDNNSDNNILFLLFYMLFCCIINTNIFVSILKNNLAFLWYKGFFLAIPVILICILILFIRHKLISKKYEIEFQINKIDEAIKNASNSQTKEIL